MTGPARHLVLRACVKMLTPLIIVFALYVQTHGDYGPGGGFQAGVLLASAVVAYGLVFGPASALRLAPLGAAAVMPVLGVSLYSAVGGVGMIWGDAFLDHDGFAALLRTQPTTGQHLGVALVEWAVFFTVSGSLISIFYAFMTQPDDSQDDALFDAEESPTEAGQDAAHARTGNAHE
jgi:multicomponent Na+:H+ antiporter subunit B